jgi:hypothetical protein
MNMSRKVETGDMRYESSIMERLPDDDVEFIVGDPNHGIQVRS